MTKRKILSNVDSLEQLLHAINDKKVVLDKFDTDIVLIINKNLMDLLEQLDALIEKEQSALHSSDFLPQVSRHALDLYATLNGAKELFKTKG